VIAYIPSPPADGISVGPLQLHFYGLLIAIGVLVAAWLAQRRWAKLGGFPGTIVPIAFWAVISGLIGARLYSGLKLARYHPPVFNLVISNVPGPPLDLYCAGAKVTGIFPMGPVMEGTGVNMTVLSEAHHLNVGVMACPDLVPDVGEIGTGFVEAVDELRALAERVHPRERDRGKTG